MTRRIKATEKKFIESSQAVRDFETGQSEFECPHCGTSIGIPHEEIFDEYRELVVKREVARTKAIEVAREEKVGICGMEVVPVTRRKYDEEALYNYLENDPELRANIIKIRYSVSSAEFDQACAIGKISPKMRDKFIKEESESITVKKQPAEIKLG